MANWSIYKEPHGKMVTCQRPIVVTMRVFSGAVAHFKGKLYVKNGSAWTDTKTLVNAYGDQTSYHFECNLAEYCRNYFTEDNDFYSNNWCGNFDTMVARTFKVEFYPVEITLSGNLIEQTSDIRTTNEFIVIPANTMARESTSSANDNIRLDKYVLNGNNSSTVTMGSSSNNRVLSNMPNYNIIDVSQGFYFWNNTLQDPVAGRQTVIKFTNSSGVVVEMDANPNDGYAAIALHPYMIDFVQMLITGVVSNFLTDALGNVTSTSLSVQYVYNDAITGVFIRSSPKKHYTYKDGYGCKSTTFIFRNMRGGFDFFTATGEEDVSVELSGSDFDRHTNFDIGNYRFGLIRGQHNVTNLWNDRKELTTLFSQPVSKEEAIWLDELIMSPQVWIIKDIKDFQENDSDSFEMPYQGKGLVAINILKGSYKLHNSEKGRHFLEFKYTLSENTITQKM